MKSVSDILKDIYGLKWSGLNILECGSHSGGLETANLESNNNCWYIEANESDYKKLKTIRNNTLNYALSDKDGKIKFNISSHPGTSSVEHSEHHLSKLKSFNTTFKEVYVDSIKYETLLNKLNLIFDVLVLDVEGHEVTILNSFKELNQERLPTIMVIECGYDWEERLKILKELGYHIDCYYFNNCYLSKKNIVTIDSKINQYNQEWKTFTHGDKLIYKNELS